MSIFDSLPNKEEGSIFDSLPTVNKQTTPPVPEDLTKPAFLTPKQPAKALEQVQAEAVAERAKPKLSYEDLYKRDDIFNVIKDYSKVALNKEFKEGQNKEAFVSDFMSKMRDIEFNAVSTGIELNKMRNASTENAQKMALAQYVYKNTTGAGEVGGQKGISPYWDVVYAIATDPSNYIGFGAGAAGKAALGRQIAKEASKAALGEAGETVVKSKMASLLTPTVGKVKGIATTAEATAAVGQNVLGQRLEQQTAKGLGEEPQELSYGQMGVAALVGSLGGYFEAKGALKPSTGKTGAQKLQEIINEKKKTPTDPNAPPTKTEKTLLDPVTENIDDIVEEFTKTEGRKVLNEVSPITSLTEPQIQKDLSQRAIRVAMHVIENDPAFRVKPKQKISSAISEVFANLENGKISDTLLEQAIRKEGLTPEDFARANKTTVTDAATVMQQYSAASRLYKRLQELDPEQQAMAERLFGKQDDITSALGRAGEVIQRVERESKAWMVSGIATTARNIIGSGVGLTFNSAASLIEGSLYTIGKTLDSASTGKRLDTLKAGFADTMKDTFSVYGNLFRQGLTGEVTDVLLKHNPALRNAMFSATQEGSNKEVSQLAQMFNTLNVTQDAFFRKAIFTAAVDKHMRRAGLDMYQTIGDGKVIPASILKEATDDALKATFSYMPKQQTGKTFEAGAETAANSLVKAMEMPGLSLVAPFARFMANAIAFQYRYSVFGAASGATSILDGALLKNAGKEGGDKLIREGQANLAKGVVGTAALAYAYEYRKNNQDTEWYNYKTDDGTTIDLRAVFPAGPLLAVGDFLAKRNAGLEPKTAEAAEAIIGMKMPAGTQNTILDQIFSAFSSEKDADRLEKSIGKVLGDFAGRFTQPFVVKNVYDFLDLFREEGSVARDPNVITSDDKIREAALNRIKGKLPVIKEELPAVQPYLREGPVVREGEFFNNLIGLREVPNKTTQEKEIARLGIDAYKLYGGSTGDKEFDREFVKTANPLVTQFIDRAMKSDRYKSLPELEQKQALFNTVRDAVTASRDLTEAKFTASDIQKIYKMKFDKLPADSRKIINTRYAEKHNGTTLEEAKDYKAVYEYEAMLETLRFALGGFVSKVAKKAAAATDVGEVIKRVTAPTVKEIDESVNRAIDAAVQAPAPAVATQPLVPKKKKPVQPVEAPAMKAPEEPMAPVAEPAVEQTATILKKPFAEESYAKAEKEIIDLFGAADIAKMKKNTPKEYENMLHVYAGDAEGIAFKDLPPMPHSADALKADEAAAAQAAKVTYDTAGNPISIGGGSSKAKYEIDLTSDQLEYLEGSLDKITSYNTDKRKEVLSVIKQQREQDFPQLIRLSRKEQTYIEPDVIAVAQGEYRYAKKKEVDVTNPEEVKDFFSLASTYQKKLDTLREKYKDTPPIDLYHGNKPRNIEQIKKSGFVDPQKADFSHAEMRIGAPSFTRDINMNVNDPSFGGASASNYVYTQMPYADYMFKKINMGPAEYDKKDLNTIARAINGSPDTVRPISLPRSGYAETEDMFVEAEKLTINKQLKDAEKRVAPKIEAAVENKTAIEEKTTSVKKGLMALDKKTYKPEQEKQLTYLVYDGVKELMNQYLGYSTAVSTRKGLGMRYQESLQSLADLSGIKRQLPKLATSLDNMGAKQKAENVRQLWEKLTDLSNAQEGIGARESRNITKVSQDIRKLIPKFAEGGLV